MLLLVDNYDSFAHNLARYLVRLGAEVRVERNDRSARQLAALQPAAVVISPGPCGPAEAGCSLELVQLLRTATPILGICLGHQVIAEAFGGRVVRAKEPLHGQASEIFHDGRGVFAGLASPLAAARYHSLIVAEDSLPPEWEVSARTAAGEVMAMRHRQRPIIGLQFHPESILTPCGYQLLAGFLRQAALPVAEPLPQFAEEGPLPPVIESHSHSVPLPRSS